jgi:hypothetical protein
VSGERLNRLHVNRVEVGAFLAVDLDVDEQLVHHRGGGLVLEGLVRHDVAPVARRITDAQQDRLLCGPRELECFRSPLIPVDRIVRVLAEIWAGGLAKTIGHALNIDHLEHPGCCCCFPASSRDV